MKKQELNTFALGDVPEDQYMKSFVRIQGGGGIDIKSHKGICVGCNLTTNKFFFYELYILNQLCSCFKMGICYLSFSQHI